MLQATTLKSSVISFLAVGVLFTESSLGSNDELRFTPTPVPDEADWRQVPASEVEGVLELLRDQTRGNYERINTWAVIYRVHEEYWMSPVSVKAAFEDRLPEGCTPDLIVQSERTLKVAIDQKSDSIFRELDNTFFRRLRTDTREPVVIPNAGGEVSTRSIVTPDDYVYFDFKEPPHSWGVLPDHPEAQNKRGAPRVAPESAKDPQSKDYAESTDPRLLFRCSMANMSWEELQIYLDMLEGKRGPEKQREAEEKLRIDQTEYGGSTWYRIRVPITFPDGSEMRIISIWGPGAGFNPVSLKFISDDEGRPTVRRSIEWNWKQVDGIYVPAAVREVAHPADPGNIDTFDSTMIMQDCTLNKPIAPEQFTYAGLGLGAGDLILDEVDQTVYVLSANGKPKRLAAFHEPYVPPPSPEERRERIWFWLVAGNVIALLAAAVGWLIWRRAFRRPG